MLRHFETLLDSRTIEDIWTCHTAKMAEYGFDRLLYGYTRARTNKSFGDPQDMMVLTNHDPTYADRFMNDGLYNHAPMVQWATENTGACSWGWIEQQARAGNLSPSELKVIEYNRSMDVTAGYSVSFLDVSVRAKGAIALTAAKGIAQAEVDDMWASCGREIIIMNKIVHLKLINLPYASARRPLTKRQREALEWVGDGKTTQDIAQIMGLTPATVEKHLRLARESLDVETTAQAVLKASFHNQIYVLEL
ncbi:helix-turn-helix transcriptional regulator [Pseudogemmobacter sp. W21_MBD1_M6]|uniref:helix-turn-helix transcriptional regulator n=1 Tax=Pseudogemmobacter sp. W21_MBD1_M6 TaxID=3240271 RepID=UPI003F999AA5